VAAPPPVASPEVPAPFGAPPATLEVPPLPAAKPFPAAPAFACCEAFSSDAHAANATLTSAATATRDFGERTPKS
jgi:hypothetical protein